MRLPGPLKNVIRGSRGSPPAANGFGQPAAAHVPASRDEVSVRASRGLEEFFTHIQGQSGLTLLDLGGASQQNVSFITELGHRFCSEDFRLILGDPSAAESLADQANPGRIEYFLEHALDYPEHHFDGVLIWDVLEYLAPPLATAVVERLHRIVRPGSYMLAFFHADDKLEAVPYYAFRIVDLKTLQIAQHGVRRPAKLFNNRSVEKLFACSESVKFFLTRDRLREVVIRV
jgi:SAM-dependent methyltransferase